MLSVTNKRPLLTIISDGSIHLLASVGVGAGGRRVGVGAGGSRGGILGKQKWKYANFLTLGMRVMLW